ncbi:phosphopantetheine-binding protein [Streptomyces sp. NPDC005876]|uniref:acyl carrier protein n=1 Tax=Streptomyces sp. NPDC005876 TaxID=3157076 RepID=UPI0033DE814E
MEDVIASLTGAGFPVSWDPSSADAVQDDAGTDADERSAPPAQQEPPGHGDVLAELADLYAQDLGFPAEMLTPDIDLEADLGVDSLKQLAPFQRVREQYGLAEPPAERRVRATTLGRIAELVEEHR